MTSRPWYVAPRSQWGEMIPQDCDTLQILQQYLQERSERG